MTDWDPNQRLLQPWRTDSEACPRKERPERTMKDGGDGDTGKRAKQGDRTNKVPSMSCPYNHGYSLMAYFPI